MFCFNGALPDKSFNCPGREDVCFFFMDRCQTRVLIARKKDSVDILLSWA